MCGVTSPMTDDAIPYDIITTLFRGLVHCGYAISDSQREEAWAWLEARNPHEEMGR